jgi:hypothetical protein
LSAERLLDAAQHLREPRALARLDDHADAALAAGLQVARDRRRRVVQLARRLLDAARTSGLA